MGEYGRVVHCATNPRFDFFDHVVTLLHGPRTRDEHVHRYERASCRLAGTQRVELDAATAVFIEHGVDRLPIRRG